MSLAIQEFIHQTHAESEFLVNKKSNCNAPGWAPKLMYKYMLRSSGAVSPAANMAA